LREKREQCFHACGFEILKMVCLQRRLNIISTTLRKKRVLFIFQKERSNKRASKGARLGQADNGEKWGGGEWEEERIGRKGVPNILPNLCNLNS